MGGEIHMSTPGGKGHAPRQQRDDEAFRRNWQLIFGDKRNQEVKTFDPDEVITSKDTGLWIVEEKDERDSPAK